jgi:aspartyl-tRNA synthetase
MLVDFAQNRHYRSISSLSIEDIGFKVWIRGRIHKIRKFGKGIFVILRQEVDTIQCNLFLHQPSGESDKEVEKVNIKLKKAILELKGLKEETVVDFLVEIHEPEKELTSPSINMIELLILSVSVVSIPSTLPFTVQDAMDSESYKIPTDLRLTYRWIDLRTPANQAIFRIRSGVCHFFRTYFVNSKFFEVHSPMFRMESELVPFFEIFRLAKGITLSHRLQIEQFSEIQSDSCHGIFELGTVHRARCASTHQHLCAFTSMDFLSSLHQWNDRQFLLQVSTLFTPREGTKLNSLFS